MATKQQQLLARQPDEFWHRVQIFPGLFSRNSVRNYRTQAKNQLKRCGTHNLTLVAETVGFPPGKQNTPEGLAAKLLSADKGLSLLALADFIRGRGTAINEEYESTFSDRKKRGHLAHIRQISTRAGIRLFTKLLLLYHNDEKSIPRIFVRKLWRSRRTKCEFKSPHAFSADFLKAIAKKKVSLANSFSEAFGGTALRFFSAVTLGEWEVFLFQREYAAIVRADFRETQKTIHGIGWVMLGFERGASRIVVKGGGNQAISVLRRWFDEQLNVEIKRTDEDEAAFSNFDPASIEKCLLGDLPSDSAIRVIGIGFKRSLTPTHAPLTIEPSHEGLDIHRDLADCKEKGLIRLRSLSDLSWFRLGFQGHEPKVEIELAAGGGVILRLDNTGLSEQDVDDLRRDFLATVGIPLDREIDPQPLLLGSIDVFNCLLELDREEGLADYQRNALDRLIEDEILVRETRDILACPKPTFICKAGGKAVIDEDVVECPECQTTLETRRITYLTHNDPEIVAKAGKLLAATTGWKFLKQVVHFEGERFFRLANPDQPDQVIRVYFSKRIGNRLLDLLDRSLLPVLVVHTGGQVEHAHLDAAGVAHLSFARALASEVDPDVAKRFNEDCCFARDDLIRRQTDKVLKRASTSRNRIVAPPEDYTGTNYEHDVFNVIRGMFPYTEFWTGANRPDGFCSLVYYPTSNLREPIKFNWSYDAKFTSDPEGYNLNVAEERKVWDYVAALTIQPDLNRIGDALNAHVIVSNRLADSQMKTLSQFVRREHRLKDKSAFEIVFLFDEFLIALHDSIRNNHARYTKLRSLLLQRLVHEMGQRNADSYVRLDRAVAERLADWVLDHDDIENPVNITRLQRDLDDTMRNS